MAGSRLEKFGTVYTRVRDLMRSGVIRQADRPIWYDVYKAFPPKRNPLYVKTQEVSYNKSYRTEDAVPDILYKEDLVRAKFYEVYWTGDRLLDLSRLNFVSTCQRFVERYAELESSGTLEESTLFEETAKALLAEGFTLRRRGSPAAPQSRPEVENKSSLVVSSLGTDASVAAESTDPAAEVLVGEQHGASSAEVKQDSEEHTAAQQSPPQ